jgi:hypothetical protein
VSPRLQERLAIVLARHEELLLAREIQELIEVRFPRLAVASLTGIPPRVLRCRRIFIDTV